ncbi:MAG TPA: sigma 54-interacting transcriptional regulator [Pseudobdellovibrionaceae bacterium]|nr:sigma 54-interacting transcriptional regulator [Pseudobdellovibrionaceae bacterium]
MLIILACSLLEGFLVEDYFDFQLNNFNELGGSQQRKNMELGYLKSMNQEGAFHKLNEFNIIGSSEGATLRLLGEGIEERHSRIEIQPQGMVIRDLRTEQGTYVNQNKVAESSLQDGDLIHFGREEFMYVKELEFIPIDFLLKSKNQSWNSILQSLNQASKTNFPILLLGPSGTGKDVLANAIHQSSSRKEGPFVSVNCSALTETLVESELFGHIKGSFTGAISDRKGAFEAARGGTLFLDEIGDLPYPLQAKLLRAIENQEIRPIGSDKTLKTDVRIVAATHQNLKLKIYENAFRWDLYFRLNVICIEVPALNQRMEDFEHLLYEFSKEQRVCFSYDAIVKLRNHTWPGNIREVKNAVSRAAAFFPRQRILPEHVDRLIEKEDPEDKEREESIKKKFNVSTESFGVNLPVIKEIERQLIVKHLTANRGNQRKTAVDLGIPKSTLHDRLKYYEIDPKKFKV